MSQSWDNVASMHDQYMLTNMAGLSKRTALGHYAQVLTEVGISQLRIQRGEGGTI